MDNVKIEVPQMPKFAKAILATPKKQMNAMRSAMSREVRRVRTLFIKTQLSGPPGIKAFGILRKGGNIGAWTHANGRVMEGYMSISRILKVHELGATITSKTQGKMLAIHGPGVKKGGKVLALVPKVVIPSRLTFRALVATESPLMLARVALASQTATQKTLEKGLLQGATL